MVYDALTAAFTLPVRAPAATILSLSLFERRDHGASEGLGAADRVAKHASVHLPAWPGYPLRQPVCPLH